MDIVFITDNNYVFPTRVAIKSLITNKKSNVVYCINIICVELDEKNINALKSLDKIDKNVSVILINKDNIYNDIQKYSYVSQSALYKFQLANIFENLDKILYLDADIIVEKDLSELYNTNIDGLYAAVVSDYWSVQFINTNGRINHKDYFNSGVMLLNLKKMRENNISEKLIEIKRREKELNLIGYMDQDILNIGFEEEVKYLSPIYNFILYNTKFCNKDNLPEFFKLDPDNLKKNTVIFHFAGINKPWNNITYEEESQLFWKYADNIDILKTIEKMYFEKKDELITSFNENINISNQNTILKFNENINISNQNNILKFNENIKVISKSIEFLVNENFKLKNEINLLKEEQIKIYKKYPKWFCNLLCCFIIKKKNRHHFRTKYCKNIQKKDENKILKMMVNFACCFIPGKENRKHFRGRYLKNMKYCPYCNTYNKFLPFGTITRENVLCPECFSLERQRFLYFVYKKYNLFNPKQKIRILHFAPEKCLYDAFSNNELIEYTCVDLCPEYYPFAKNIKKEDGMNLSFKDKTFDVILHNHVLEHVPNDKDFIKENLRVLKDDGIIIASFPYDKHNPSYFNDDIKTPEERTKYFHQCDHVRLYGTDFKNKLEDVSYNIQVIYPKDVGLSDSDIKNMSIKIDNNLWFNDGCVVINKL